MDISSKYLADLVTTLQTGSAREHAYRPAIKALFESIKSGLNAVNDPARSEHGAPDFIFFHGNIIIGYAETKDINIDLDRVEKSEQMNRYFGYSNLILTNYLEFRFYRNGERYGDPISIGILKNGVIVPKQENAVFLEKTIGDFLASTPEQIKSGERLAKVMGGKARRIRENVSHFIKEESEKSRDLKDVYDVMKKLLVHDLDADHFADMYAQTLVYGLFIARYHDDTLGDFSRQEAIYLLPASNPLLQHFFDHIAGPNFDKRLGYIVDELCEIFAVANVRRIMDNYYSRTTLWGEVKESPDPVIHFYEDFLKEYDSEQRVKLGAFYTPLPVVKFIVRGIDYLLKKEFGLLRGLADTSKKEFFQQKQGLKDKVLLHQVQILDPATGTGTFLNEIVKYIHRGFEGQQGRWTSYVDDELLPRLHGFELMMAPYTIAHLKLGMTLRDMGYEKFSKRLGIYLTNSLEDGFEEKENLFTPLGFMKSIAEESKDASIIKNEKPIMVVLGNPPYSGESSNTFYSGHDVYKVEIGGNEKLKEKNSKWLSDDYVKFIRLGESMIEKNGEGIVGMITSHGYIDNPTFRGMRWHLRQTFDTIYILDLHGNANKEEMTPEGNKDENVFNIKTGVSIIFGIKKRKKGRIRKNLAKVYRADLYGTRKDKYAALAEGEIENINWNELPNDADIWKIEGEGKKEYLKGFSIKDLCEINSVGIVTARDEMSIKNTKGEIEKVVADFSENDIEDLRIQYDLGKDVRDWSVANAKKDIKDGDGEVVQMSYRPFDIRWTFYTGKSKGFHCMPRGGVMKNLIKGGNIGLVMCRQVKSGKSYQHCFVTKYITESTLVSNRTSEIGYVFPLYVYRDGKLRMPNINKSIEDKIHEIAGETRPEDIFCYIYAVLHSPGYREKYKEFLKNDFPRVPFPKDSEVFWELVKKGSELQELHLMESAKLQIFITTFPEGGSNTVEKIKYDGEKVFINEAQYFGNVPEIAWNFHIGAYQPAQKWLKDRRGQSLSNQDLEHYQRIIAILFMTDKIMKEIDNIWKKSILLD